MNIFLKRLLLVGLFAGVITVLYNIFATAFVFSFWMIVFTFVEGGLFALLPYLMTRPLLPRVQTFTIGAVCGSFSGLTRVIIVFGMMMQIYNTQHLNKMVMLIYAFVVQLFIVLLSVVGAELLIKNNEDLNNMEAKA